MRSLTIAQSVYERNPNLDIRFILSEQAPYASSCPFPTYICPSSPTKHTHLVNYFIDDFDPTIVVFDASGRVAQLKHAKHKGASTIFICQHNKKLAKALRFRRLRFTDKIWVVQPKFAISTLSVWSKLKLKLAGREAPEAIGPIFYTPNEQMIRETLQKHNLESRSYILVNAGSGGHVVNHVNAAEEFSYAANIIANSTDIRVVVIYGPNFAGKILKGSKCLNVPQLDARSFSALLSQSKAALLAGGSALFQGISFGINIVSAAVSKDQDERINICVKHRLVSKSVLEAQSLADTLLKSIGEQNNIESKLVSNGLAIASHGLIQLSQHTN